MATDVEKNLAVHEAVCGERYKAIEQRMKRMEILQFIVLVAVLLGPGAAGEVIKKLIGL